MSFIDDIKSKAKKDIKTIVLPESDDERVVLGGVKVIGEGFAKIVFIGKEEKIKNIAKKHDLDVSRATIIDPENSEKTEQYAKALYELRKDKGMTEEQAKELILDPVYYGMMMVKLDDADGLVSGANHSTADTLRPALQILKTSSDTKLVSAFFVMVVPDKTYGADGVLLFGDCALNENPNALSLAEIARCSSNSFKAFVGKEPKVAMLSYSTYGSAASESVTKVREATNIIKEKYPELKIDGELQLDAAIIKSVAEKKAPGSDIAGEANVLIFPDLNAGNIGYKLVQRFAHAEAYGPICQGIAKPVNDLSRGCSAEDVAGVVAFTAVQAQMQK
ncbi:MAG: phosphate acetyltransferase [Clostridia bacterium]|nr:phosphate acetyltransferase [Clostridia bacterium]